MAFGKKKPLLLILTGMLTLGILYTVVCSPLCSPDLHGMDFPVDANCTFLSHLFAHIEMGLAGHFVLVAMGLFFFMHTRSIPEGFFQTPFRPPRYLSEIF